MRRVKCCWQKLALGVLVLSMLSLASCQSTQPAPIAIETGTPGGPRPTITIPDTEMPTRVTASPVRETATPVPETATALPEVPFDTFIEDSFAQLMRNDPEWATTEGVADQVGANKTRLTDFSPEGIRQTQELQRLLLGQLRTYPRALLSREQQITYDAYEWYLDDLVRGQQR